MSIYFGACIRGCGGCDLSTSLLVVTIHHCTLRTSCVLNVLPWKDNLHNGFGLSAEH